MPRIKVTGYVDTDELADSALDPSSITGVNQRGEDAISHMQVSDLEIVTLRLEAD